MYHEVIGYWDPLKHCQFYKKGGYFMVYSIDLQGEETVAAYNGEEVPDYGTLTE